MVVSAILLATRVWFDGVAPREFWRKRKWLMPHFLAMGFVGAWLNMGPYMDYGLIGVGAFIAPVVDAALAVEQYVDTTAENVRKLASRTLAEGREHPIVKVSDELGDSYDGTLEALVNALDARDQETKGHSIRASHYMMDIAREFGRQGRHKRVARHVTRRLAARRWQDWRQ